MEQNIIDHLTALSHPQRLAIFRLLMRRCPDALPAGEIAEALDLKASTASVYLSTLTRADLITQRRDATRLLYCINLETARGIVEGLFVDCCRGRADLCPPALADIVTTVAPAQGTKFNVLFICTGNSARSIFAEAILREMAGDLFNAYSAGTVENSDLNPHAVRLLTARQHDVTPLRAKNVAEFRTGTAPQMDFVFTVCDRAANEECPVWQGKPISGHWGVADPAKATGSQAEMMQAFQRAHDVLYQRISAFISLPIDQLDRRSLQTHIDEIGRQPALTQE
ncbi:transcriptional regulator, ArsR family [Sulfitobacter brevis]|uniref:Transcriptional regulator, ArsR family n=1 Tax=Sulfitobacter brevis TaxID=74348 RepID=A0A1I2E2S0_9RHOB|nr:helix-turn-helix domain-containing protein [Sulfitobacter brevis]SFE86987.1 transcriptional regulator, ArsR family [Sulfitobacter brevis]